MFLLIKKESTLNRNTPLEIILSHCGVVPGEESSGKIWSEFQRLFFSNDAYYSGVFCTEMGDVIKRRLYKL